MRSAAGAALDCLRGAAPWLVGVSSNVKMALETLRSAELIRYRRAATRRAWRLSEYIAVLHAPVEPPAFPSGIGKAGLLLSANVGPCNGSGAGDNGEAQAALVTACLPAHHARVPASVFRAEIPCGSKPPASAELIRNALAALMGFGPPSFAPIQPFIILPSRPLVKSILGIHGTRAPDDRKR